MTVALDSYSRFPDTDTVGFDTTTGDRSFTHNPIGVPKGVVVIVASNGSSAPCTGVTYAGVAMTLEQSAVDTSEAGWIGIWVLSGVAVPTTDPATVVLQGCDSSSKWATCMTVLAATTGTQVVGKNGVNTTTSTNPTVDVVTSAQSLLHGAVHGGASNPGLYANGTGYTWLTNADYGQRSARVQRSEMPVAAGTIQFNFTYGTSDDWCIAAVALGEYTLPVGEPQYDDFFSFI